MGPGELDDVDHAILAALQEDARNNTNAAISERVGVSPSTVGKRIKRLEADGVLRGYVPVIDYERAGFPLHVLFVCTATIPDREALTEQLQSVDGIVFVRELMTGQENVHIQAVGTSKDDITAIARQIDRLGFEVVDEVLMRDEYVRPSVRFTRQA